MCLLFLYSQVGVGKDLLNSWKVLSYFWSARIWLRVSVGIKNCVIWNHIQ